MFNRKKDYKYEFLPSNLEIIERPPSPLGGFIIYLISGAFVILLILSFVLQIDIVTTTTGVIDLEEGIKMVNSNASSKIISIEKKQGDLIKKDEIIMQFETDNLPEIQKIEAELNINNIKRELLSSEINKIRNDWIIEDSVMDEVVKAEIQLEYITYWNKLLEEERQYEIEREGLEKGYEKKDLTEEEKKKIDENLMDLEIAYTQGKDDEKLSLLSKLSGLDEQILENKNNLDKMKKTNEDKIVRSPVDGIIALLNYNTVGSYLSSGLNIAEIVPTNTNFFIKTKIENKDVSKIKIDQSVIIKIDAYDYQTFGELDGKIQEISATSQLSEDKSSLNYEVKVSIENTSDKIQLKPGMTVALDIKTDRKRIIEYFFDPVMKTMDEAF